AMPKAALLPRPRSAVLEDIIETILGQDIVDETDSVANLRHYAKQRWVKRIKREDKNVKPAE
ncbi:MAG TPA: hypothetical protein DD442_10520, partial [Halomonas sp.]|nr:hypothetical protein [Halomonas sp.]